MNKVLKTFKLWEKENLVYTRNLEKIKGRLSYTEIFTYIAAHVSITCTSLCYLLKCLIHTRI